MEINVSGSRIFIYEIFHMSCSSLHHKSVVCFDSIGVSLDCGLYIWICMSLLNIRFSQISFSPLICSTNSYEHEIFHSTFNVSCFWFQMCFRLLWLTDLDVYVSCLNRRFFLKTHFVHWFVRLIPMSMRFPTPPSPRVWIKINVF